ncbi:TPA: phage head-binding domain-containing protein [Citrobacter freundii]
MSDITANVVVSMPSQLFTLARSFKANANGKIYIGQIDTDPVNPANQIPVYIENEDGSHVQVAQPIIINAGGFPVYNGQIAKFVTVQGHSMAVYDSYGTQQFYYPNVLKYDPDQLRADLQSDTLTGLVNDNVVSVKQPFTGARERTQHDKNKDVISVADFDGFDPTGTSDSSDAFNDAMQAAKLNAFSANTVTIPAGVFLVKDVVLDSPVNLIGAGKLNTTIRPVADGDTCFKMTSTFGRISGITIQSNEGITSNSTGISVEAALNTIDDCSFAFLKHNIFVPQGVGAGELNIRFNRFAASLFGVVLSGGNTNTRFLQNTFSDCKKGVQITEDTALPINVTEGITFSGDRFYSCGDHSTDSAAIEIIGTRWIWLDNVMSDLAKGIALRATNTSYLRLTGGYYSSNQSVNQSGIVVRGDSPEFTAVGTIISDSRNFGMEINKLNGKYPARANISYCTFQLNDIDAAQTGDLLVNSSIGVSINDCTLKSNKPNGLFIIDNLGGGSSVFADKCSYLGGGAVGGPTCKLLNRNSPTHPEEQNGVATIANGFQNVSVSLTIKPLIAGNGIAVLATPSSGNDVITAGATTNTLAFNRVGTSGDVTISFKALTAS